MGELLVFSLGGGERVDILLFHLALLRVGGWGCCSECFFFLGGGWLMYYSQF